MHWSGCAPDELANGPEQFKFIVPDCCIPTIALGHGLPLSYEVIFNQRHAMTGKAMHLALQNNVYKT